ncbi:MAG TPA: sigma-70 family RNA polymerase sigma factor [Ktedonobacterales bacterium]|nr:sigma-70 family RNA polymerase sigma factor [Ktedonobacterales bacterium]
MDRPDPAHDALAAQFEANRPHLRAVAYRLLGSASEADDAVQESWLRLSRADMSAVQNLSGWLTTVVARVCLDMLRSHKSRREEPLEEYVAAESITPDEAGADPEQAALMADSVGLALLVVLDTLNPAERLAFVLHDVFDVSFDEIAPIVGRTPMAARQLASRARRRVQGAEADPAADPSLVEADQARKRAVVKAFLMAAQGGDFGALLAALDPEVTLRADAAALATGAQAAQGAQAVAAQFSGRAHAAQLALVDGAAGLVWAPGGQPRVVFAFTLRDEKIIAIEIIADPERLSQLDVKVIGG